MIIYGSRMYGRKNPVEGWGFCESCGNYEKNISYDGRKWGHLYFIPLIPVDPAARVIKQCTSCSHGLHIPQTEIPNVVNSIQETTKKALAALIAGQEEFKDQGTKVSATACLAGSVEMLHCLQADEHLQFIVYALKEKNLDYPLHLVEGESDEFQGKLDEAAASYKKAVALNPNDIRPLMAMGSIHLKKNDPQSAKTSYEKALALSEDRLPALGALIGIYAALDESPKLVETYEECFGLVPDLANDKKTVKGYKKACKEAGRAPSI